MYSVSFVSFQSCSDHLELYCEIGSISPQRLIGCPSCCRELFVRHASDLQDVLVLDLQDVLDIQDAQLVVRIRSVDELLDVMNITETG